MDSANVIVAVDVGTSSVRALAYDASAKPVPGVHARAGHAPRTDADGAHTFDADEVLERVLCVLDETHAQLASVGRSASAVAMDTFVGNLLGVDSEGRPLTRLITYADTRSASALERLQGQLEAADVYDRSGAPLHTAYWPVQLRWLHEECPETWQSVAQWITFGAYALWRVSGKRTCSYSAASWTGLLDRRSLAWDDRTCAAIGVSVEQLSPLASARSASSGLRSEFATRWPLYRDALWFPAVADGVAANIGSGCVDASRAAITIGTTAAMRAVVPGTPNLIPPGLWCYRVDETRSLLGGAFSEGGNLIAWLQELMGESAPDEAEVDGESLTRLAFLPLVAGERAPGWRPKARGALTGLSLDTTPAQIVAAAMDGVAVRLGRVAELLFTAAPEVRQFVASGAGLLGSRRWMGAVADVLGEPLFPSAEPEATSRGTAMLALEAMGALRLEEALPPLGDPVTPEAGRQGWYSEARTRQDALYKQTA